MAVPARLLPVDGEVHGHPLVGLPFGEDLLVIDQIILATGAIDDIHLAVAVAVVPNVVDDRAQRRQTDAAGDEEQILALEGGIHREGVAVGAADGDLLAHLHLVEPLGDAAALFNGELHKLLVGRGRGDGEHGLAHPGDGEHGALARLMLEGLFPLGGNHPEGFYVGRIDPDIGDDADRGDQRFLTLIHVPSLPTLS